VDAASARRIPSQPSSSTRAWVRARAAASAAVGVRERSSWLRGRTGAAAARWPD
jgi:hypothetical protein